jgi:NADPH:quinone reductase-like Zn-dependent oxidoreductase
LRLNTHHNRERKRCQEQFCEYAVVQMRLVRLRAPGGLKNLKLVEEDHPKPRPGELLVRIRASSLNFHDEMVVLGKIPCADRRIPMSDGAGEVIAIGEDVDEFKVADTVVSTFWPYWLGGEMTPVTKRDIPGDSVDGYAREYVCMPAHAFTKAPAGYTHVEASTLTCAGVTAWRGLVVCGQVKPGDTVLILGTGGVSLFALQFAKVAGARVIATSSSEEKLEKLKHLGADTVINYKAVPDWGQKAKDLTDGRDVDHVIEVGGPGTLTQSIFGRIGDPGTVFESDSYQRNLHWQQSRSRGHDSGDYGQSFGARYRPPFSAPGNRCCLQV